MSNWYLEGFFTEDGVLTQQHLKQFPVVVGRSDSLEMTIKSSSVSRSHARLDFREGKLWLTDLQSRNGTFVNRKAISAATPIDHGDVLHFGTAEMRLLDSQHNMTNDGAQESTPDSDETKFVISGQLSQAFPSGVRELEQLLTKRQLSMVYQPIIEASRRKIIGYEVLGRGAHPTLPASPFELFRIAESIKLEVHLSETMRDLGVEIAVNQGLRGELLVNTHPSELLNVDRLLANLRELRQRFQRVPLVLEIHEQSVIGHRELLRTVKKELESLHIKLAFDDFGVGQSRLLDMVDAKPELIKFDKVLIEGIDKAEASHLALLQHLLELARSLNIHTLAECVATEAEYRVCEQMKFEFYQGYYFAKPAPVSAWLEKRSG